MTVIVTMSAAELAHEGQLRFFRTEHAVVLIRTPDATYKLARLTFGGDGSIYVQFPYLEAKAGVIAELPVDKTVIGPVTYDLANLGETVDTDVKFSHHASGQVRFSKTGHRIATPPRQSFPLNGPI